MSREAQVDPNLLHQIARASGLKESVAATITLRGRGRVGSPEDTEKVVRGILARIAKRTRSKPNDVSVFPHLYSFAIDAPPPFVEELLRQPEVDSAMASHQEEDFLIRPVDVQEVSAEEVEGSHPASRRRGRAR